jgi:hypothetical protein
MCRLIAILSNKRKSSKLTSVMAQIDAPPILG